MINTIYIKNYILIDDLTIDFSSGLNVITGETGAGKSIIINAIDIAFGAKVSGDVIKKGAEKAVIELFISSEKYNLKHLLDENGIDYSGELVISREITPTTSRVRVNGSLVNQNFVKNLKNIFLDIHSQHQTYSFMQPKSHIVLLDNYSKEIYGETLSEYKKLYSEYTSLLKESEKLKQNAAATENQIDFLNFQINEIENAGISDVEEEENLKNELKILENAENLKESTYSVYWALCGDDGNLLDSLQKAKSELSKASVLDEDLVQAEEQLIDALETLKDVAGTLRYYSENVSHNEERLNEIQERLYLFDKLKRKYGSSLEEILNTYDKLSDELASIEFSGRAAEKTDKEIKEILEKLISLSEKISKARKKQASELSKLIEKELEKLELAKSRFEIKFQNCELSANGSDDVEFYIATNVSNDLAPLSNTASGGEISRVMLAIKTIFAKADDIDTVIFDEIDTGISGKAAQSVAEEIAELADFRQIILITHQAVIAAKAHNHFFVSKKQGESTTVSIKCLSDEEKISAIASLASGEVTESSIDFAKSLLKKS